MNINKGIQKKAQKVVIYGPEGIGKSTFASKFPKPLFIDTEGSTSHMDVSRFDRPTSWAMLMAQIEYVKQTKPCKTLVIDTADWAESLCKNHVISVGGKTSIEEFGYGKGFTLLSEEWGKFLNKLQEVIDVNIHVVISAHAMMRKFEEPSETGTYDRFELKLEKKTAPMTKEWADMVLFANYQIFIVNVDGQGAAKGKNKAQGGKRVMYTTHHPAWDAKNRHDLIEKLDFDFNSISQLIADFEKEDKNTQQNENKKTFNDIDEAIKKFEEAKDSMEIVNRYENIPASLRDLMKQDNVTISEIESVVSKRGYYSVGTPIENYEEDFINGVLVAAWNQVAELIKSNRKLEEK